MGKELTDKAKYKLLTMKSHKAFGDAFEYLFSLGCQLPRVQEENLYPTESIYRALYIQTFNAPYIISLRIIDDVAELTYCVEDWKAEKSEQEKRPNADFQWLSTVIDAFNNAMSLPNELEPTYRFFTECRELTPSQLDWFITEINALNPLSIKSSSKPDEFNYRDGGMRRGIVRIGDGDTHTFDLRPIDLPEDHADQAAYYLLMYKLAASVCIDEFSRARLVEVQRTFFGNRVKITDTFAFELIR